MSYNEDYIMQNKHNKTIIVTPEILLIATFHQKYPEVEIDETSLISKLKTHAQNKVRIKDSVSFFDVYLLGKYIGYTNKHSTILSKVSAQDLMKELRKSGLFERKNTEFVYTTLSRSSIAARYNEFPNELKKAIKRAQTLQRVVNMSNIKDRLKASKDTTNAPQKLTENPTKTTTIDNNKDFGKEM